MRKLILLTLASTDLLATTLSTGVSHYRDADLIVQDMSFASTVSHDFLDDENYATGLKTTASVQSLEAAEQGLNRTNTVLGGTKKATTHSLGLVVSQNLTVLSSLRLAVGGSTSNVDEIGGQHQTHSNHAGVGATSWLFNELVRLSFDMSAAKAKGKARELTATDGARVTVDAQVDRASLSADLMQIATSSTIIHYQFSTTKRSDRPNSSLIGLVGKQHFQRAKGAVHFSYRYYENVGVIKPITTVGEIISHTSELAWYQKFKRRFVASMAYRYHQETENPREVDLGMISNHSHGVFSRLKCRLKKVRWSKDSSSVDVGLGVYRGSNKQIGYSLGLGGSYVY